MKPPAITPFTQLYWENKLCTITQQNTLIDYMSIKKIIILFFREVNISLCQVCNILGTF